MMSAESFPSYRAPQNDRQILCVPPWSTTASDFANRQHTFSASQGEIAGIPIAELARAARSELVLQAEKFTHAYRDQSQAVASERPIIITGHQPGFV
ncbi:MAG: hypothetical protein ACR2NM_01470, partial [Bythopirellula sp.]